MKRKKQFVSPRVLGQVEVCLEGDLLVVGASMEYNADVITSAVENVDIDTTDGTYEVYYD
ncbi:MAG: hypothetical protein IKW89_13865 [Bacteroidales bacterium]|nr:hypothetical protein [Bacteroidales bacterium]